MTLGAAALLGLLSSLHCVAMCGPLALLATGADGRPARQLRQAALYHAGRTSTYVLLGAIAGALGQVPTLMGAGRFLAIAAGALLVVGAIAPRLLGGRVEVSRVLMPVVARAASGARRVQARYPKAGVCALGMANGLVPCGMLYSALLLALTAASPVASAGAMAVFGAATAPALVVTALAAATVPVVWRKRLVAMAPVAVAGVGVLLVVRGLTTICH